MCGATPPLPNMSSWLVAWCLVKQQEQFYCTFVCFTRLQAHVRFGTKREGSSYSYTLPILVGALLSVFFVSLSLRFGYISSLISTSLLLKHFFNFVLHRSLLAELTCSTRSL
jgi:hypothetical protein